MLTSVADHGGWGDGPGPWFLERHARGEIAADDYRERLTVLKEDQ